MSDLIHLLPDSVANQIAAGEVIQRPASVIKELMENALDAGAKHIHVVITDAGRTCIRVVDDGKGMSETDARLSFERHATSKIQHTADLFALQTMGFRGEALASIAAVAQVELKTRREVDSIGTKILISGSKVEYQGVIACPVGCNFSIKNLFFNIPARRKFLKADAVELAAILTEFERVALVHPGIAFYLHHNESEMFNLPPALTKQRILAIFGKKLNEQLLAVKADTGMVCVSGFTGKPETSRKRGVHQFFFVNGRYMRHPYFHKAVNDAYEGLVPKGEQVPYFLYFEVNPADIDVNIHPAKIEIKFENDQFIWKILFAAIKESLGKFNAVPSIDFDTEGRPDIPIFEHRREAEPPKVQYNGDFNPFKVPQSGYTQSKPDWESVYTGQVEKRGVVAETGLLYLGEQRAERGALHLQFKGRYILTSVKSGLMLIDQHRAHIRILFDRYMKQIGERQGMSQRVLFPERMELPGSEVAVLQGIMVELTSVGFELSDLGGGCYVINAVPADMEGTDPGQLIRNMIYAAGETGNDVREEIQTGLALTLARASAIVYGQVLSNEEMGNLVDMLFACQTPSYTPTGQPVLTTIKEEDIERLFK